MRMEGNRPQPNCNGSQPRERRCWELMFTIKLSISMRMRESFSEKKHYFIMSCRRARYSSFHLPYFWPAWSKGQSLNTLIHKFSYFTLESSHHIHSQLQKWFIGHLHRPTTNFPYKAVNKTNKNQNSRT